MPQAFPDLVRRILPTASKATIAAIQAHFPYPLDLPEELAWDWTTAIIFECNAYNLATAYKDKTRRYIMSIPPAVHGEDMTCKPPNVSLSLSVSSFPSSEHPNTRDANQRDGFMVYRYDLPKPSSWPCCQQKHRTAVPGIPAGVRRWLRPLGDARTGHHGRAGVNQELAVLRKRLGLLQHYQHRVCEGADATPVGSNVPVSEQGAGGSGEWSVKCFLAVELGLVICRRRGEERQKRSLN